MKSVAMLWYKYWIQSFLTMEKMVMEAELSLNCILNGYNKTQDAKERKLLWDGMIRVIDHLADLACGHH